MNKKICLSSKESKRKYMISNKCLKKMKKMKMKNSKKSS